MHETHTIDSHVGRLAIRLPAATRVFLRHNIDFCCGGNQPLRDACAAHHLDPQRILEEILQETPSEEDDLLDWREAHLGALTRHIVEVYHAHHKAALPALVTMAAKVHRVHGERDPQRLAQLEAEVQALSDELQAHMIKEERVLFPWIEEDAPVNLQAPIARMLTEHDDAGASLARIRDLTDTFTPPGGACRTWRGLYSGLEELDLLLRKHIHLENNILFPRALGRAV